MSLGESCNPEPEIAYLKKKHVKMNVDTFLVYFTCWLWGTKLLGCGNIYFVMAGRVGNIYIYTLNLVPATQTFNLFRNISQINTKTSKKLLKETKADSFGALHTAFCFLNIIINYKWGNWGWKEIKRIVFGATLMGCCVRRPKFE